MKLQSRCPHCHQIEPMGVDIDTQASHECPSCGLRYVPLRRSEEHTSELQSH